MLWAPSPFLISAALFEKKTRAPKTRGPIKITPRRTYKASSKGRNRSNRLPQRFQIGVGVAVVDGFGGVAGEKLADFLGNPGVGHGGVK